MTAVAWLKITYDQTLPGEAMVLVPGRQRRRPAPGQWVVFDKDRGIGLLKAYHPGCLVFASGNIDECHRYIGEHSEAAIRRNRLLDQLTVLGFLAVAVAASGCR